MHFANFVVATFAALAIAAPTEAEGARDALEMLESRAAAHCPCYATGTCGCTGGLQCYCEAGSGNAPCAKTNTCGCYNGLSGYCKKQGGG